MAVYWIGWSVYNDRGQLIRLGDGELQTPQVIGSGDLPKVKDWVRQSAGILQSDTVMLTFIHEVQGLLTPA